MLIWREALLPSADYFTNMLDPSMNWRDVAEMVRHWDDQFCLKGVMSVDDAQEGR